MSDTTNTPSPRESLATMLRALKLPAFTRYAEEIAHKAEREGWSFCQYLRHLAELEIQERQSRRMERYLKTSDLPREKTLATLSRSWLSPKVVKTLPSLCEGGFVERGDNVLVFGLPGRGKTHLVCAIGHELIQHGYRVLFTPTFALVQRLLAAKRDLRLEKQLATLDRYDAIILDLCGVLGNVESQSRWLLPSRKLHRRLHITGAQLKRSEGFEPREDRSVEGAPATHAR
jgi:DNA replication protein DnaC